MTPLVRSTPWGPTSRRATRQTRPRRLTREEAAALWAQADDAADEAVRRGEPVALPAMTAGERRVVLDHLLARIEVHVHAGGEDPQRHLVVVPL